ncbi:hypothetical protein FPV67DRAFT_1668665 [Lyophyllum atratum]|nr:hypothetical protein FPV67DRAFT_1668665 [Lyophyllum atratum]
MSSLDADGPTTIIQRFSALAISEGLKKKSKQYKDRRRDFIQAEVESGFVNAFGGNVHSLQSWKQLCRTVGIPSADDLTSITQCKAALSGMYVNIVDLVDTAAVGKVMTIGVFSSEKRLGKYIRNTGKIFPKNKAKANKLLRQFLIKIG